MNRLTEYNLLHCEWNRCLLVWGVVLAVSIAFIPSFVVGVEPDVSTPPSTKAELVDPVIANQNAFLQTESGAIDFVKQHHPELVSLLQLLKAMKEKEYEVAIRDIDRARKRLDSLVKREPETYQIELDAWKIQSKIDLLLAKGFAQDKAFSTKTLRGLLKDQVENQEKRLKNERSSLVKRKHQIDEQLEKFEGHESEKVDQQFAALMKRVDAKVGKPATKPKPETKPNKEAKEKS